MILYLPSRFLLALCCFIYSSTTVDAATAQEIPYGYFDSLRENSNNITQVEFAHENSTSNVAKLTLSDNNETFRLAHLAVFIPFQKGLTRSVIADSAALLLAVDRFNRNPWDEKYFQCDDAKPCNESGEGTVSCDQDSCANVTQRQKNCNIRLTTEFFDTEADEVTAAAKLGTLLERENGNLTMPRPSAIIGEYYSSITSPLTILAGIEDVPQISGSASSAYLDDREVYPLFARTITSSDGEASAIVDYYRNLGVHRVSILYISDAFGSALQRNFEEIASGVGMQTAYAGYVGKEDIPSAIQQIKASKHQHIFCIAFDDSYEIILEEAYKAGLAAGNYAWLFYGTNQFNVQDMAEYSKFSPLYEASKGVAILSLASVPQTSVQFPGRRQPDPLPKKPTTATEEFMYAWKDASTDTKFLNYLRSKMPFDTFVPDDLSFMFSENLNVYAHFLYDAITSMAIAMCQADEEFFTGPDVMDHFSTVRFEGISGHVRFNEVSTREYTTIRFAVWNLIPAGEEEAIEKENSDLLYRFYLSPTSTYAFGKWQEIRPFVYADGSTIPPEDLIPVESTVDDVNDTIRYIGIALSSAIMAFFVYCMVWTMWLCRAEPIVLATQPSFLMLIAFGSLFQAASIIPLSYDYGQGDNEGDAACMAVPWLFYIGLSFTCAGLYCKIRRLYEIYRNPELDRLLVEKRDFIFWPCLVVGMNAIILALWTALSPLKYEIVPDGSTDVFGRSTSSHGVCQSEENNDPNAYWLSILLANVVTLLIANWYSYKCRAIETEYQEAQFVAFSLGTTIEALVIGSAMQHATKDTPDAHYVITMGSIFLTSFVVAALIFLPKMMSLRKEKREKQELLASNAKESARSKNPRRFSADASSVGSCDGHADGEVALEELLRSSNTGVKVLHHPGAHASSEMSHFSSVRGVGSRRTMKPGDCNVQISGLNPDSGPLRSNSGPLRSNSGPLSTNSGPLSTNSGPLTNDGQDCSER